MPASPRKLDTTCPGCRSEDTSLIARLRGRYACHDCGAEFVPRAVAASAQHERLRQSRSQETRGMRRLGGRKTVASGATRFQKGDGTTSEKGSFPEGVRVEFKTTINKGYRLTLDDLVKVQKAREGGEMAVFVVEFRPPGLLPQEFYIFSANDAEYLLELERERRADRDSDD